MLSICSRWKVSVIVNGIIFFEFLISLYSLYSPVSGHICLHPPDVTTEDSSDGHSQQFSLILQKSQDNQPNHSAACFSCEKSWNSLDWKFKYIAREIFFKNEEKNDLLPCYYCPHFLNIWDVNQKEKNKTCNLILINGSTGY